MYNHVPVLVYLHQIRRLSNYGSITVDFLSDIEEMNDDEIEFTEYHCPIFQGRSCSNAFLYGQGRRQL